MTETSPAASRRAPGAGWALRIGLLVVLGAAAALSFETLRDLGEAVRISGKLAPLLPIAIDSGAAISCATWLSRQVDEATARFARRMTTGLLVLTVVGNAAQLGMHANGVAPPWWVAVAVGAIPPGVVGATVHLLVLACRTPQAADIPPSGRTVVDADLRRRAGELVLAGAGRPRIATELGLTDHQARRLVQEIRQETPARQRENHRPGRASKTGRPPSDHAEDVAAT